MAMPWRPPIHKPHGFGPGKAKTPRSDAMYHNQPWRRLVAAVLKRDAYWCRIRGPLCTGRANTADHIIAREDRGPDTIDNLRAVCPACHNRRHAEKGRAAHADC
jgi:5-methylcytosine-specific restriction endonuclease McrA